MQFIKNIEKIEEIVNSIVIKPKIFLIKHSIYELPKIDDDLILKLQELPQKPKTNYFNSLLEEVIHNIYYDGSFKRTQNNLINSIHKIGFSNKCFEVDWEFCERLHSNNKGQGSFHPWFRVVKQEVDSTLAVEYLGITVHIQPESHLRLEERSAKVGDMVAISMPSSQLKPGYYTAIGDVVLPSDNRRIFIYFNFSPEGAIAFMRGLTTELNYLRVFFTFLVDYNPSNYGGYYSGYIILSSQDYKLAIEVIRTLYEQNQSQFQHQIPIFNKQIAPGISLEEKPEFDGMETFAKSRCGIVANALLEAYKNGDESPESRMKYIRQNFEKLGIDIERPYLNPNSEDIYTPIC